MKRLENETYQQYRERRKKAQSLLKSHLRGKRLLWDRISKRIVKIPVG